VIDASQGPVAHRALCQWISRLLRTQPGWSILLLLLTTGCPSRNNADSRTTIADAPAPTVPVRPVRVRLSSGTPALRIQSDAPIRLIEGNGAERAILAPDSNHECTAAETGIHLDESPDLLPSMRLETRDARPLNVTLSREEGWLGPFEYPGSIELRFTTPGQMEVINLVDVESYVASVTAGEVWPSFHVESFRAQAICARTYVLYQMMRRAGDRFDVSDTAAAQVYQGIRRDKAGNDARDAAAYTRGLVCTWSADAAPRLLSTYYSAACGGQTQSAAIFGPDDDIPPLRGGVTCDECKIAPGETYRWPPVRLSRGDVFQRLVERYPEMKPWGGLAAIEIDQAAPSGRATHLRLLGPAGQKEVMLAERFRLAIGSMTLRSTHFSIRLDGNEFVFENGRGFGHGIGLCQWGMEGRARAGMKAGDILQHYYPGSRLQRVY